MSRFSRHRSTLILALAALILRAAIPAGYMPASVDSGLLFKLCPSGVPAGFMAAISSTGHDHHEGSDAAHFDAEQCPIGQSLSAAIAVDDFWLIEPVPLLSTFDAGVVQIPVSRTPANYHSRDPPV